MEKQNMFYEVFTNSVLEEEESQSLAEQIRKEGEKDVESAKADLFWLVNGQKEEVNAREIVEKRKPEIPELRCFAEPIKTKEEMREEYEW